MDLLTNTMELKHALLLWLSIHTASALSFNNVLNQINSYIASPLSLFQSSESSACDSYSCPSKPPKLQARTFPCCVCGGCKCSYTSCPRMHHRPGFPVANWDNINSTTPIEVATAGCGANYTLNACLRFVLQYFDVLEPALEIASNHSRSHYSDEPEEMKKAPCCGDSCSDSQCLKYLAMTVRDLRVPINGTLDAGPNTTVAEPIARAKESEQLEEKKEEEEVLKSEL